MKITRRVIAVVVLPLLLLPADLMSQLNIPTSRDWHVLQQLPQGDKLRLERRQDKPIEGRYRSSTDTTVTLTMDNRTREIQKADVTKIYLLFSKRVASTTLKGTAIGARTGATLGGAGQRCNSNSMGCALSGLIAAIAIVGAAIPGAIIGLIVGAHHSDKQLIYES